MEHKQPLLYILIFTALLTGCSTTPESITITEEGVLTTQQCNSRNLENKIIMIESKYCGHCKETKPAYQAACEQEGVTCEIIDVTTTEGSNRLEELQLTIQYTPTFLFDCRIIIGAHEQEYYEEQIRWSK